MTTNNHPAHGPVSLDRLHQISEILSKAAAQSDGGNLGYAMADAVKVIDGAVAARNAEPVALRFKNKSAIRWDLTNDVTIYPELANLEQEYLYAVPQPAPVVPENCVTAEHRRIIEMLLNVCGAAFELADDSCQQDVDGEECHVVPDDAFQKLSDALDEIENTLSTEDVDRPDVFLAWSAMPRAALKSILQAGNSPVTPVCWCSTCRPVTMNDMRFVVCPECGNKCCPHANDHRNDCTGSNEPGQVGSTYPSAPQQE
ncbi:hypothetical protein [Citrobacter portucalensis]|uniref:hypothetical protein n=1 Tax=Citrobacter portucalensis TaxID=1639133 RepID=UPI0039FD79BE